MPAFKDLYEMIKQLMDEEEEEMESTIREAEKEIEGFHFILDMKKEDLYITS